MNVQTGDDVKADQLLATIDRAFRVTTSRRRRRIWRWPQAQLANAKAQLARSTRCSKSQAITQTEYDGAKLDYANAYASVIRAQSDLENARDAHDRHEAARAAAGTIIAKNVELGTVSRRRRPTSGAATVLFRMANLDTVQVRTLVDETDIGKVQPGLLATITVDAIHRPFEGAVLKIEPQASVQQNVRCSPSWCDRESGPSAQAGDEHEVEIHVGRRDNVIAIPNAALRTQRTLRQRHRFGARS